MQPPTRRTLEEQRARAETAFKARHDQAVEAPKATQDYRDAEQQKLDQMTKLRKEREARDAVEKA
jgi:hypothetical protein